ncbi:hypothetical protein [Hansschlegelia zhihuaiae]|uniref:Uncharacterized protein n=1 Tax=Hansschlegelia zhihuaiae TaxID=405005 RepID=A0A4Q0M4K2_9HYPH|nr:hypothetical protein [Hansschlegelia zhihuaiae]RXF67566.1 hypothetical protein EK403_21280 [Hansschlegelia zhihuaiae]
MNNNADIAAVVATAVTAIEKATLLIGTKNSGIDDRQIRKLREAIDQLELRLNEKKRMLDADGA